MPKYRTKPGALFDVKPVDDTGSIDVGRIEAVQYTVNLSSFRPKKLKRQPAAMIQKPEPVEESPVHPQEVLPPVISLPSKENIHDQFEELLNYDLDLGAELANFNPNLKPEVRPVVHAAPEVLKDPALELYAPLLTEIHRSSKIISQSETPAEPEVVPTVPSLELSAAAASDVHEFYTAQPAVAPIRAERVYAKSPKFRKPLAFGRASSRSFRFPKIRISRTWGISLVVVAGILALLVRFGFHMKRSIMEQGSAAVTNLQSAQGDLKTLDFKGASQDFFAAYANFSQAGNSLNVLGAGITGLIGDLPGAGSLKSAQNLVKVGQLLSAAGTSMTAALDGISRTGALSDPTQAPIGPIVSALKKALVSAQQQVAQASTLMSDIDPSIIPADKQAAFTDFKSKMPEFETAVNMSADYAKFFENLINAQGYKRYLVMFQNGSELRPTGGFPGTYGVLSFKDGQLDSMVVDDVYNIDGQLKDHIIPPLQMQHITPTWGMRDANWYADFPTSAKNIEAFYQKEADQSVDGVIVINPEMIQKILAIVGPISMPQYNLTLNADNVLTTIQDQVEYGSNRTQPKQIVKDFAPLLMSKIYSAGSDKWLAIFNTLVLSMNQHDVLMSFNNLSLESFVTDKGFGGQVPSIVSKNSSDYIMPIITNVKGSKTDAVTDTSFKLDTSFDGADAIHTLTITRTHNGGSSKYGFYNKQNPAYVRVLVPDGSELISIAGNDKPNFKPLLNYSQSDFKRDDQLTKWETSGIADSTTGVTTYRESGEGEFGFWLITDPGTTKTVTLKYRVPKALTGNAYDLYVQKQPALKVKDFSFSMDPGDLQPQASYPTLTPASGIYKYDAPLENDLEVKVNFQ